MKGRIGNEVRLALRLVDEHGAAHVTVFEEETHMAVKANDALMLALYNCSSEELYALAYGHEPTDDNAHATEKIRVLDLPNGKLSLWGMLDGTNRVLFTTRCLFRIIASECLDTRKMPSELEALSDDERFAVVSQQASDAVGDMLKLVYEPESGDAPRDVGA